MCGGLGQADALGQLCHPLPTLGGVTQAAQHGKQPGDCADTYLAFLIIPIIGIRHAISHH
ncbi:hypothetical protein D3C76_1326820 [compost metagenome]